MACDVSPVAMFTDWLLTMTFLMWPWGARIPLEDFTDVTLVIEDTDEDDVNDDSNYPDDHDYPDDPDDPFSKF